MTSVILGQHMGHTISPVTFLSTAPSTLYIIYTNPGPFYNGSQGGTMIVDDHRSQSDLPQLSWKFEFILVLITGIRYLLEVPE